MKTLIIIGGFIWIGLFLFHALFWRLFDWKNDLEKLNSVNKAIMQVMNFALMLFTLIFAYISFFHAEELLTTPLGKTTLIGIVSFGIFRASLQPIFFNLKDARSKIFFGVMILGTLIYLVPLISIING